MGAWAQLGENSGSRLLNESSSVSRRNLSALALLFFFSWGHQLSSDSSYSSSTPVPSRGTASAEVRW